MGDNKSVGRNMEMGVDNLEATPHLHNINIKFTVGSDAAAMKIKPEEEIMTVEEPQVMFIKHEVEDEEERKEGNLNNKQVQEASVEVQISHGGNQSHTCNVCGKTLSSKRILSRHIRRVHGERLFQCHHCSKSFVINYDLCRHMRTHTGEKPYTCHICGKSFSVKGNLCCHMKTHTGEKPYTCHICGRSFRRKFTLIRHIKGMHLGVRFSCEQCGKSYTTNNNLMRHVVSVHCGRS